MSKNQNGKTALVHWIYTRDEWDAFLRWKKWRSGIFPYLFYRIFRRKKYKQPEIFVTAKNVLVNDIPELFNEGQRKLKRVSIRDAGNMNVMEIIYEKPDQGKITGEIEIPVPKGKLKEAMDVQEKLSHYY